MNICTIATDMPALQIPREVTALIAALQLREPDTAPLQRLDDQEWTSLLTFCDLAHLTLPLAQLPEPGFPSWVVERLRRNAADNALRFERMKATYKEAAQSLDNAGVDHILIKGFTQAPDYVKDPRFRAQSDIDLYCPPAMIESARIALQSIGYKPDEKLDYGRADHVPTMVRPGNWQWKGNPFDPEMPLSVELHFCLWNEAVSLFPLPEVDDFWERRTTRVIDGLSFSCLSPVDHLGYLTLHILRNLFSPDWVIHHVRELATFLHSRADDNAFWTTWSETHSPSLRSFEAIAFYYARSWFGCDLHQVAENEVSNLLPMQQRWLHRFVGSALESMFQQNKDSVWLHLSFLKSSRAKIVLLRRVFVPSRISSINSPAAKLKNRQPRRSNGAHPHKQYVAYLASRCISYTYFSAATILRGLRWRLSQHQLVRQFWIFLAASFFLT
jgi:hypothetical protein